MRRLIILPLFALLTGCVRDDSTGMIATHDGRIVAETAEVATGELIHQIDRHSAEAAGPGWAAGSRIGSPPEKDLVRADQWGWRTLAITLELTPPMDATPEARAAAMTRAEAAARGVAAYRVRRLSDVQVMVQVSAPSSGVRYTVQPGDTLVRISTAFYGTPQEWRRIADANPGSGDEALAPGRVLIIPSAP
jgi:LysM repeat protein